MRLCELEKTSVINTTNFDDNSLLVGFEVECLIKYKKIDEMNFFKLPNWHEILCSVIYKRHNYHRGYFDEIDISDFKKFITDKNLYKKLTEWDTIDISKPKAENYTEIVINLLKQNPDFFKAYFLGDYVRENTREAVYNEASIYGIKKELKSLLGIDIVGDGIDKDDDKDLKRYYLDGDSSIEDVKDHVSLEIVSPPLSAKTAFDHLEKIHNYIKNNGMVNSSCGVHINISRKGHTIDPLKLILFTGTKYILELMNRIDNDYINNYDFLKPARNEKKNQDIIHQRMKSVLYDHYGVINNENQTYYSFRHIGAVEFINNFNQTMKIVKSFVRNIIIASSNIYDKEYKLILYKLSQKIIKKEENTYDKIYIYSRKVPNSFDIKNTNVDDILKISHSLYRKTTKDMKAIWCGFKKSYMVMELPKEHTSDIVKKYFEMKYKAQFEPSKLKNI
jgi:hypothetical protein